MLRQNPPGTFWWKKGSATLSFFNLSGVSFVVHQHRAVHHIWFWVSKQVGQRLHAKAQNISCFMCCFHQKCSLSKYNKSRPIFVIDYVCMMHYSRMRAWAEYDGEWCHLFESVLTERMVNMHTCHYFNRGRITTHPSSRENQWNIGIPIRFSVKTSKSQIACNTARYTTKKALCSYINAQPTFSLSPEIHHLTLASQEDTQDGRASKVHNNIIIAVTSGSNLKRNLSHWNFLQTNETG